MGYSFLRAYALEDLVGGRGAKGVRASDWLDAELCGVVSEARDQPEDGL